jgi:hypothetical protein
MSMSRGTVLLTDLLTGGVDGGTQAGTIEPDSTLSKGLRPAPVDPTRMDGSAATLNLMDLRPRPAGARTPDREGETQWDWVQPPDRRPTGPGVALRSCWGSALQPVARYRDIRRVLGSAATWIDQTFGRPAPPSPRSRDPLAAFVS